MKPFFHFPPEEYWLRLLRQLLFILLVGGLLLAVKVALDFLL